MSAGKPPFDAQPVEPSEAKRLDSWKEIAAYLKRDESTVRRWEREGLPVHRHMHSKKAAVYAYKPEIDAWWRNGSTPPEPVETRSATDSKSRITLYVAGLMVVAVAFGLNGGGLRDRLLGPPAVRAIASIAVLPWKDVSADPSEDYFVDGMTDALINELRQVRGLRVISRTSTMRYKETDKDIPRIARELGVEGVIEASVVREGELLRISVRLIDGPSDRQLWAQSFERELHSIQALHRDIARAIAHEINVALTSREQRLVAPVRRIRPRAYEAYLKGHYHFAKRTREGLEKAVEYFQEAIRQEPTYAPAYAGLADSYNGLAIYGHRQARDVYPMAIAALFRALELDETLSEAHASLGVIKFRFAWDWKEAERRLKHALQLDPDSPRAHLAYGMYLERVGRLEESLEHIARYRDLDPVSPFANLQVAHSLYYLRRYDAAIVEAHKALELDRNYAHTYRHLGQLYASKQMMREATAACDTALRLAPDEHIVLSDCGHVYALSGRLGDAVTALDKLLALSARTYVDPYFVSVVGTGIYTDPAKTSRVFVWLARAFEERSPNVSYLNMHPAFDGLRDDSRFHALLRRMNLPQ